MSLECNNKKKKVLIIDGQGGGIGRQLTLALKQLEADIEITAVGTNALATSNMLKAGADNGATGENAVIVGCRKADIIVGPIGIAVADSLFGEVTPKMALAVGQSNAVRVLIPVNHCDNMIAGVGDIPMAKLVENAVELVCHNI